MNAGRIFAVVVAIALLAAEIVRPTTIPPKRLSHPSVARSGGPLPLSQEQLDDLPPIVAPATCNIDALHAIARGKSRPLVSGGRIGGNDTFVVSGWCADPEAHAAGAGLVAIVDGSKRIDVSTSYGGARTDVVRAYANPAMLNVGFDIHLAAGLIGTGVHDVRVAVVARDGRGLMIYPIVSRVSVAP